jgi:hypothetical protein
MLGLVQSFEAGAHGIVRQLAPCLVGPQPNLHRGQAGEHAAFHPFTDGYRREEISPAYPGHVRADFVRRPAKDRAQGKVHAPEQQAGAEEGEHECDTESGGSILRGTYLPGSARIHQAIELLDRLHDRDLGLVVPVVMQQMKRR